MKAERFTAVPGAVCRSDVPGVPGDDIQRAVFPASGSGRSRIAALSRVGALAALVAFTAGLTGCGLAAAPCRVASAGLKIVPLVGHVAAAPTDACAAVIDP